MHNPDILLATAVKESGTSHVFHFSLSRNVRYYFTRRVFFVSISKLENEHTVPEKISIVTLLHTVWGTDDPYTTTHIITELRADMILLFLVTLMTVLGTCDARVTRCDEIWDVDVGPKPITVKQILSPLQRWEKQIAWKSRRMVNPLKRRTSSNSSENWFDWFVRHESVLGVCIQPCTSGTHAQATWDVAQFGYTLTRGQLSLSLSSNQASEIVRLGSTN